MATATAPELAESLPSRKPDPYQDGDLVTCLHGYGRVRQGEKHWVDNVLFTDGIAHNVPYLVAKTWAQKAPGMKIYVLPNEAEEPDYARVTGVVMMTPEQVAVMLTASDLDQVFEALGSDRARLIAQGLGKRLGQQIAGADAAPKRTTR